MKWFAKKEAEFEKKKTMKFPQVLKSVKSVLKNFCSRKYYLQVHSFCIGKRMGHRFYQKKIHFSLETMEAHSSNCFTILSRNRNSSNLFLCGNIPS